MELIQILPGHLRRFAQKIQDGTCTDEEKKEIYSAFNGSEKKRVKKVLFSTEQKLAEEKLDSEAIGIHRGLLQTSFIMEQNLEKFTQYCLDIFKEWKDPYTEFLTLYDSLHDRRSPNEGTMTEAFAQHYVTWMTSHPSRKALEKENFTEEVQERAYHTITMYHLRDYESLTEIFHFNAASLKEIQQNAVKYLVELKRYKEAMLLSLKTGVRLKERDFLIPLIFQGCLSDVIDYCNRVPKYKEEILQFVDGFCFRTPDVKVERMRADYGVELVDEGLRRYLLPKIAKKAVHKMLDEFDLKDRTHELARNFWWLSREEAIKWFQNRRYSKHTLQKSCFDDFVMKYLDGTETNRKVWFINELWKDKDNREASDDALEFKMRFGLEDHLLKVDMLECISKNPDWVEQIRRLIEKGRKADDLTNLTVGDKPIVLVDSVEDVKKYIAILKEEHIIGIDSETVDEIILPTKMALLQISISSSILLFDFYKLEKKMSRENREEFMAALLMSDGRKLGFDFVNDLTTMTVRGGTKYVNHNKNCVCLKKLITLIQEVDPEFIDLRKRRVFSEDEADQPLSFGLSDLCKKLLNVELDKSEQLSNWSCRPLRAKQVKYAALDAEILITVYEKIRERVEERGLDFEELINASLSDMDLAKREKRTRISIQNMKWEAICDVLEMPKDGSRGQKATDYKCAVDQMHLGLGIHLRRLGIDVYIPTKNDRKISDYCLLDTSRKIISSGEAYRALHSMFQTRVLNVSNGLSQIEQLRFILGRANIRLDKKDTFSRCKECNQCRLVIAPMPVIEALIRRDALYVDEKANVLDGAFELEDSKQKLRKMDCLEYDGYGCRVDETTADWFQVDVFAGRIDIDRAVVIHENADEFVEIRIDESHEDLVFLSEHTDNQAECRRILVRSLNNLLVLLTKYNINSV